MLRYLAKVSQCESEKQCHLYFSIVDPVFARGWQQRKWLTIHTGSGVPIPELNCHLKPKKLKASSEDVAMSKNDAANLETQKAVRGKLPNRIPYVTHYYSKRNVSYNFFNIGVSYMYLCVCNQILYIFPYWKKYGSIPIYLRLQLLMLCNRSAPRCRCDVNPEHINIKWLHI